MRITLLSPYHGGSHQAWAEGYIQHSTHDVRLFALPDRFWKWRMHGGAVTLARRFLAEAEKQTDVILVTDMLDLTTFMALSRRRLGDVPTVLYMHENQLTYPLPPSEKIGPMRRQLGERDQHYAFVNYASMLVADLVLFNSHFHERSFFEALPRFLKHFPEYNELGTVNNLRKKSEVLPVGIDLRRLKTSGQRQDTPPLILWNQRWEYDKDPEAFFRAVYAIASEGIPFRLALCGQQFGKRPRFFDEAIDRLADQIVHVGHAAESLYRQLLWEAAVTVSTAQHEFFGISILEAIYACTFPILPNRLSYPELIPKTFHSHCLYQNQGDLERRLRWTLTHPVEVRKMADDLATAVSIYDWSHLALQYDNRLSELVSADLSK